MTWPHGSAPSVGNGTTSLPQYVPIRTVLPKSVRGAIGNAAIVAHGMMSIETVAQGAVLLVKAMKLPINKKHGKFKARAG